MLSLNMRYSLVCLLLLFSSNCLTINDDKQCSIRDSCSNSSLKSPSIYNDEIYIQSRNCFCDSACEDYGDCCNHPSNISNYYECTDFLSPTFNNKTLPFSPLLIWMRTKCLSIYIGSLSDTQCRNLNNQTFIQNPLAFIPVTSLQTNITYRNYFCAYCNNDANMNIQFWEYQAFCNGNGSSFNHMILTKEEQVNYYFQNLTQNCLKTIRYPHIQGSNEPSVFIRPCKKSLPPICPSQTPIDLARNCSLSGPTYRYDIISKVIYHNPYCAQCNNRKITCLDPIRQSGLAPLSHIRIQPLSILFDPNLLKRYLYSDLENNTTTQIIQPKFPFYRNILSIICTSISLLCLLIFGISFWLIPSLHNLPGKCLLFLSISLFIGQLTFISTSDLIHYSSLCFISGIFIHYFYLSSFFWLLIIAIHIHSTFNRQIISRDKITKKRFHLLAYNILVWCSTGIPILIACLIQFLKPQSKFSPDYGFLFCSISKSHAMILFFLIPIGCLLLIIAILFLKTILTIYHSYRIAKLATSNNHEDKNLVFIYVRLASLMGLQWILLIGALIIQKSWLWIIFEIINSLPGVFICFGFLCSQKLWNDVKQNIAMKLTIRRQSSRSNTISTSLVSPPIQQ